jgi:PhnB protein
MKDSGYPTVIPMVAYEDAGAAADWLCNAFGFRERRERRFVGKDGLVGHAELEAGNGLIMLATPSPDYQSPARHQQECEAADRWLSVPWVVDGVLVHVPDVDVHMQRAVAAGAHVLGKLEDGPDGRLYRVEDLEGHRWMFHEPM